MRLSLLSCSDMLSSFQCVQRTGAPLDFHHKADAKKELELVEATVKKTPIPVHKAPVH